MNIFNAVKNNDYWVQVQNENKRKFTHFAKVKDVSASIETG